MNNHPSLHALASAFYADRRLNDPARSSGRSVVRMSLLCANVFAWHSPYCPRRHIHAALAAEIDELPGLTNDARAAALEIVASAFYPIKSDQEKEPS